MFEKIEQEGVISFYYNCEDMFNDVCTLSAYMAKNASTEAGALLDNFAITDDEREMYDYSLTKAASSVYESFSKIGKGYRAYDFRVGFDGNYTTFKIIDNKACSDIHIDSVDSTIEDCLRYGILAEFYSVNTNDILRSMAQEKFASNLLLLNQRLFQLKKKKVSSLL